MDTIRADNEVVPAGRAVGEAHPLRLAVVIESVTERPSRIGTSAPRAEGSCSAARRIATQAATPSQ